MHFAFELFEEDIVSFQLFEDEGEGLEGLAADVVLHAFDVAVDGFGVETEAGEEAGEDVVAMGDGLADGAAMIGEDDAAVALVDEEAFGIEFLDHGGDAGLRNAEVSGNIDDARVAFLFDQIVDLFEVVLDGARLGGGGRTSGFFGGGHERMRGKWQGWVISQLKQVGLIKLGLTNSLRGDKERGMNRKGILSLMAMLGAGVVLTGCGKSESVSAPDGKPRVVATTTMIADLVRAVAGDAVVVEGLMGPGVDPHLYKPSGEDARRLRDAGAIFYNGLQLEGRMAELFERMGREGKNAVALGDSVAETARITPEEAGAHADPHIWGDVGLWAGCVNAVVEGLSKVVPGEKAGFEERGSAVRAKLMGLDAWVKAQVAMVPKEARVLITSHDAFSYFGRAYGFEVLGVQGISTVSEAGLADVAKMVDLIKQRAVKAVFVESSVPPATIERISADSGAKVGGELFSDALGTPGEMRQAGGEKVDVGTYEGMIRFNVSTIVEALK